MSKKILLPRKSYKERYDLIRHPDRIRSSDVIERVFENLCYFNSPDPNLIAARGIIGGSECIILGQEKRRAGKESKATGMVLAKGYSFALDVLDIAEKECLPVISIIDTFGGDSSMNSEIDGQSFLISDCISRFCSINVPTLSYIIGEGGSGGALALQVADRSFMLENALYSVIAPESCSRIIFHKRLAAGEQMEDVLKDALEVLRPGADHILQIGMIDEILPEPEEGAHVDYNYTSGVIRDSIIENLAGWMTVNSMGDKTIDKNLIPGIVKDRRMKVLNYGDFIDSHDNLAKREINGNNHEPIQAVDIEREDFHTLFIIKAHLERIGIEDTELYNCEKEWDKDKNLFKVAGGCGYISLKEYIDNFYSCPKCGKGDYLSVEEQIEKICDSNTFFEIEPDLTLKKLNNNERYYYGKYKDSLDKLEGTTFSKEGLVTGTAKLNGKDVVVAITDLKFMGGSFGAAFGEKFKRAVDYSLQHRYPFITICTSGGARMNEGPMALAQMAKMNMSLLDLKKAGILYLSIIASPTTGGAYASFVTQGDIIIGEKGGLVEFAGPRVVLGAGFDVDREIVCTDHLFNSGKIQHLVLRKDLKDTLSWHIEVFYGMKHPETRNIIGRVHNFRKPAEVEIFVPECAD